MNTLVFRKIFGLIALYAILSMSLNSCGNMNVSVIDTGNRELLSNGESRPLALDGDFRGIELTGVFDVIYVPGEDCVIEAKARTKTPYLVKHKVKDGILKMHVKSGSKAKTDKFLLTVQAPELEFISISGACKFRAEEGIIAEAMSIEVGGAADIYIKGVDADRMGLDISGAARIIMEDLTLNYFNMSVSGASKVKLTGYANESDIEVSGASYINLKEFESAGLNIDSSGASMIRR